MIPRIELGTIPSVNVVTPQITLPVIPEVRVNVGDGSKPRVIKRGNGPQVNPSEGGGGRRFHAGERQLPRIHADLRG